MKGSTIALVVVGVVVIGGIAFVVVRMKSGGGGLLGLLSGKGLQQGLADVGAGAKGLLTGVGSGAESALSGLGKNLAATGEGLAHATESIGGGVGGGIKDILTTPGTIVKGGMAGVGAVGSNVLGNVNYAVRAPVQLLGKAGSAVSSGAHTVVNELKPKNVIKNLNPVHLFKSLKFW